MNTLHSMGIKGNEVDIFEIVRKSLEQKYGRQTIASTIRLLIRLKYEEINR